MVPTDDLAPVNIRLGVPQSLWSCHATVVDGKVIEGHVPAAPVSAFLKSPGASLGIGVGGMPTGSPGMEAPGYASERYDVMRFGSGTAHRLLAFGSLSHMKKAKHGVRHHGQDAKARNNSKDQNSLEMPMQEIENFTRHLRLPSNCGPYWHNTGQTLQQACVNSVATPAGSERPPPQ